MDMPPEPTRNNTENDKVKETEVYKALEAMTSLEVTNLNELIGKAKAAKTRTSRNYYDKKIKKLREKILKYMFQLNRLTHGEVEDVLDEIEAEQKDLALSEESTEGEE